MFTEADIISSYTEEQAVEDGVLVHAYPQNYPWLLVTAGVFAKCEAETEKGERTLAQVLVPLMQDCVMQVRKLVAENARVAASLGKSPLGVDFAKLDHTAAGTVWIRPNSKGGMTIMNPEDN